MKDDEKSIEELCRPLSAKIMPRSAMHNIGGREMDAGRALTSQRNAIQKRLAAKKSRKKK